ncbi:MAG: mandelate racemase/muconate lactonizing enzyme family protein [Pirellulaceae bacterium]|nr:mandelate racemase/muconate lactonizing enzyme family protein [Pirellulaceae bacterium]
MNIESIETFVLELPLTRPIVAAVSTGDRGSPCGSVFMPCVKVVTDEGIEGIGYAWCIGGGGKAMNRVLCDDMSPLLLGENALDHERLWEKLYWATQPTGRHGLVMQAQSAIDLALWDIKGKAAEMPLHKLFGGMRDRAPLYGSDGGWLNMSVEDILVAAANYLAEGMYGIKLKIGHADPMVDVHRLRDIRLALGSDVWISVDANQKWDYTTAIQVGRELEQLGIAWYEEPMICENVVGHARLAEKLDVPIALGETLGSRHEIGSFLQANAVDIVQPDITRVGGMTEILKVIAMAGAAHRTVEPHLMMEASVHLACGLPGVTGLEYMPWLTKAFTDPPQVKDGQMLAPTAPGLGLEFSPRAIEHFRIA